MTAGLLALNPELTRRIPYSFAKTHGVLLARESAEGGYEVWARPNVPSHAFIELQRALRRDYTVREMSVVDFEAALNRAYESGMEQAREIVDDISEDDDLSSLARNLPQAADLLESEDDAPVVRLINALLTQALREGVSDIHLEPFETRLVVRFRVDGVLRDVIELQKALHGVIVSRVKILSRLDIAEKRLPQDGRFTIRLAGKTVDVRVSTLLAAHGERVVMRLLDKQAGALTLPALGLGGETLTAFDALLRQPHGIILVTGPTGSGKTTTLYAGLTKLNTKDHNIMTVEDPVEYALEGVGQTQVNPKIELTFARALRAILRQDPDIVMIGEIRDLETAQIAVQASLTGHLVLATLHTNDAAGAVTRLDDMGVEPFLVASSLLGVLAQRLVRKLCTDCREAHAPDAEQKKLFTAAGLEAPEKIFAPKGCKACGQAGYLGRTGIYELLTVNDGLRQLIHARSPESALREQAKKAGMKSLREDGLRWVIAGVTSLEEVLRVSSD